MCEHVCEEQGKRVTNLRAAEKELRDENRKLTAEIAALQLANATEYNRGLRVAAEVARTLFSQEELAIRGTGHDIAAAILAKVGQGEECVKSCEWTAANGWYSSECGGAFLLLPRSPDDQFCSICGSSIKVKEG